MTRGTKALVAVAVVVIAVVLGVRALGGGDDDPVTDTAGQSAGEPVGVPALPADMPDQGMYVESTVTRDGEVEVRAWLRSTTPIEQLDLTTTDPDLAPGGVESLDVSVRSLDDKLLARRDSVGTNPQKLELRRPTTELYLTYTIEGGLSEATETVQGRQLVRVLGMDVSYAGATGSVRRVVKAPGTVINVACLQVAEDEQFDASPRPCGAATDDGGWAVDLTGEHRTDRLLAQIEG